LRFKIQIVEETRSQQVLLFAHIEISHDSCFAGETKAIPFSLSRALALSLQGVN